MSVPTLSRGAINRSAEIRGNDARLAAMWESGRLLIVDDKGRACVLDDGPALCLRDSATYDGEGVRLFLGVADDGTAYWGTCGEPPRQLGARPLGLRDVGAALDAVEAALLVTTVALVNWHASHPRCPRCGAVTRVVNGGWSRHCDVDDSQHFPRTDPAVIVLLHDGGDRVLLGRQPAWPSGRYSTIAGFVESGESAEQAVHREVQEETGADVADVVYRGSQPWPFPQSLMLGYEALVVGGEIGTIDHELEDVRWFTRDELRAGGTLLPPPTSIAHWLITTWLDRPA